MINSKYGFTGETQLFYGIELHRIRALTSFGQVSAGDVGGWIEKEENLAASGDARVSGAARVSGDAQVSGDAHILTIGPIGSRSATITIHADALLGVRFTTGCFSGCRSRFVTAVADTHRSGKFRMQYDLAVKLADISVIPCPVGVATGAKIATP